MCVYVCHCFLNLQLPALYCSSSDEFEKTESRHLMSCIVRFVPLYNFTETLLFNRKILCSQNKKGDKSPELVATRDPSKDEESSPSKKKEKKASIEFLRHNSATIFCQVIGTDTVPWRVFLARSLSVPAPSINRLETTRM